MALQVEVFYSFQNPYSYLAMDSIYELGEKYDIDLIWQPFSAKASGQQAAASTQIIPEKFTYLLEDTKRTAAKFGLPLTFPENWPAEEFDPGRVIRGALAASDLNVLREYNIKVFQHWWGEGQNPNTDEFFAELCQDLDIDLGEFLSKSSASEIRERVKGIYNRGKKLQVFDTPTIVINGERFWGLDKIGFVDQYLRSLTA